MLPASSGFKRFGTDYKAMLADKDIDAVIIATRHGAHAPMVAEALAENKTVFVEKPLAIDVAGAEQVRKAMVDSGNDRFMVGFNRRFSPLVAETSRLFSGRSGPLIMSYRVHAGQLDQGSWYLDTDQHGTAFYR